jgi:hypothetical protein
VNTQLNRENTAREAVIIPTLEEQINYLREEIENLDFWMDHVNQEEQPDQTAIAQAQSERTMLKCILENLIGVKRWNANHPHQSICAKCSGSGIIKGGPTDSRSDSPCDCSSIAPTKPIQGASDDYPVISLETSEREAKEPETELDYAPELIDKTRSEVPANTMLRDVSAIGRKGVHHA